MSRPKIRVGALFAGYAGIELALAEVAAEYGAEVELVWYCEIDRAASKILAHHFPNAVNLGDVTKVDWHSVPEVDVITGGSPCQDLSHAGKRAGMTTGTRSNLWVEMREAIAVIRPRLVVWENVRGAGSAEADSGLEQCPRCVGDPRDRGPVLRALGRVLGDLSDLGFDAWWYGLPASSVGAPHGRFRYFLFATPADADLSGLEGRRAGGERAGERPAGPRGVEAGPGGLTLLPTPAVNDMGAAYTPETWDEWTARMKAAHGNGNGHGKSLAIEAQRLLPTPTSSDAKASGSHGYGGNEFCTLTDATVRQAQDWREYEPAIRRWEALTRPAPPPTEPGAKGQPRLSPLFVEWLMGLPAGHVTDPAIGISRNDQLKALGNGVVPQQCAAATRAFIADTTTEAVAS